MKQKQFTGLQHPVELALRVDAVEREEVDVADGVPLQVESTETGLHLLCKVRRVSVGRHFCLQDVVLALEQALGAGRDTEKRVGRMTHRCATNTEGRRTVGLAYRKMASGGGRRASSRAADNKQGRAAAATRRYPGVVDSQHPCAS